jgi:hypothetical protein
MEEHVTHTLYVQVNPGYRPGSPTGIPGFRVLAKIRNIN